MSGGANVGELRGTISNIQRFCVHDGPGIRTVIFMKGCPLRCTWCSNPETQSFSAELAQSAAKCIRCGRCETVCPTGAITMREGLPFIDRKKCSSCFLCVKTCYAQALHVFGEELTVNELYKRINSGSDWRSNNGITVSGGEPLMQAPFVAALLQKHRRIGMHTAIETSGYAPWDNLKQVAAQCDLVFMDIKHFDEEKHRQATGLSNKIILENAARLTEEFPKLDIIFRTPVIPGVNNSREDVMAIASFIKTLRPVSDYELLPYHGFGAPKYEQTGREYAMAGEPSMKKSEIADWNKEARRLLGIECEA